ncbi:hypothetical protein [Fusobacterium sp. PH5-44]|uniref:hypothetical protein n=1 Tax=unclassified Fusobacterium TaxID=2648384 RepID=UPI003D22D048
MKKYLSLIIIIIPLLYSCNKNKHYKLYTESQKKEILKKMQNGDKKSKSLYLKIYSDLSSAIEKGDEIALKELDKWESLISENSFMKIDEKDYSKYKVKSIKD